MFEGTYIPRKLFDFVREKLPDGSSILEFGSGAGSTYEFSKYYNLYSIEQDAKYINKYNSTYIYSPIKCGWYDVEILKKTLFNLKYDLVLVDGPVGSLTSNLRLPLADNLHLLDLKNKWLICDDTHRETEQVLLQRLKEKLSYTEEHESEMFHALKIA